jgi:hypothetical protein
MFHKLILFIQVNRDINISIIIIMTAFVVQWSQFLATDPEARVQFSALPEKK